MGSSSCDYAAGDIAAMRDVFHSTRQLPLAEWHEYWAMEAINDRGVGIDLKMVKPRPSWPRRTRIRSSRSWSS